MAALQFFYIPPLPNTPPPYVYADVEAELRECIASFNSIVERLRNNQTHLPPENNRLFDTKLYRASVRLQEVCILDHARIPVIIEQVLALKDVGLQQTLQDYENSLLELEDMLRILAIDTRGRQFLGELITIVYSGVGNLINRLDRIWVLKIRLDRMSQEVVMDPQPVVGSDQGIRDWDPAGAGMESTGES